jgi:hypothetical protein
MECEKCGNPRVLLGRAPNNEIVVIYCVECGFKKILNNDIYSEAVKENSLQKEQAETFE